MSMEIENLGGDEPGLEAAAAAGGARRVRWMNVAGRARLILVGDEPEYALTLRWCGRCGELARCRGCAGASEGGL